MTHACNVFLMLVVGHEVTVIMTTKVDVAIVMGSYLAVADT